jgi:hypothetical protein
VCKIALTPVPSSGASQGDFAHPTELSDYESAAIKPMPPNKPRGIPRVKNRSVLNGIFWA